MTAGLTSEARADIVDVVVSGQGLVSDDSQDMFCTSGSQSGCSEFYGDEDVTLTATPDPGWQFDGWAGDCDVVAGNTCTFTSGSSEVFRTISASFSLQSWTLIVSSVGLGQILVQGDGENGPNVCSTGCSLNYADNTVVTLQAAAVATNSVFVGWTGGSCSGSSPTCTITMNGNERVAAIFDGDADRDGVLDSIDQCPNTPPGAEVDEVGCEIVPPDDDGDGVNNDIDQCPNTAAGASVDAVGCSDAQSDMDGDGVLNPQDACPATPIGEAVDAQGCSESQKDDDDDGVNNALDQCPNTPLDTEVDDTGCPLAAVDDDEDGVANDVDLCPDTEAGASVDDDGCADSQRDNDEDGVSDADDSCPSTPPETAVDAEGCSNVQNISGDLGELSGLNQNQKLLGSRIDEICPRLLVSTGTLNAAQRDLRDACVRLESRDTTDDQARDALSQITLSQIASQRDYAIELSGAQNQQLTSRMGLVRSGGGKGINVTGLNIRQGDSVVPGHLVQSAADGLLGLGASEDESAFSDFGNLGIFLQGDLDFGDRDASALESGYDFDSWHLTLGADYRFSPTLFGGGSISIGEAEVDYDRNGGESNIENWNVSLYGGWQITEGWYLDSLLTYGQTDYDLVRNIRYTDAGGNFDSSHRGKTDGDQLFLGFNTGYMWNRGAWRFGPVASLTWLDGDIGSYREKSQGDSSQAWNFDVDNRDFESKRLSAGFQADYAISTSWGVLIPGVRAMWVYETEDDGELISMRLVNNPFAEDSLSSDMISVATDARDNSFLDTSLNLSGQFAMGFSGYFSYQFYSAYDGFSREGFTFGARWDKPF